MNTLAAIMIIINGNSYGSGIQVTRFESMTECTVAKEIAEQVVDRNSEGILSTMKVREISCHTIEPGQ